MFLIEKLQNKIDYFRTLFISWTKFVKVCQINGEIINVDITNSRDLTRTKAYITKEPDTLNWIANYISEGDNFYDIGSNTGLYSIYAVKKHVNKIKVFAFEPESQNFATLNRNIYLNHMSSAITSYCLAISNKEEQDKLYIRNNLRSGEAIHGYKSAYDDQGNLFNPVHIQGASSLSLDDLCFKYTLDFPNHIKIDVDGQEYQIILGAKKTLLDIRLKSICIEITESINKNTETDQIYKNIKSSGFEVIKKSPIGNRQSKSFNVIFKRK